MIKKKKILYVHVLVACIRYIYWGSFYTATPDHSNFFDHKNHEIPIRWISCFLWRPLIKSQNAKQKGKKYFLEKSHFGLLYELNVEVDEIIVKINWF